MPRKQQPKANDLSEPLPTGRKPTEPESGSDKKADGTRTETPAKPGMPGSVNDTRRCTATAHRTGERCKAPAIRGGSVCRVHGGSAPAVRKAAKERLLELVDPALVALHKVLADNGTDDTVKVRAALGILDRTGFRPGLVVAVEPHDQWSQILEAGSVIDDRSLGGGDHERAALDNAQQLALDARDQAWRPIHDEDAEAYEQSRIYPDENTVPGVVVGPYDRKPDLEPTDPPRYWDEEAREADR